MEWGRGDPAGSETGGRGTRCRPVPDPGFDSPGTGMGMCIILFTSYLLAGVFVNELASIFYAFI